jgi:putative hydrolase of the HAD superfamily
MIRALFLDLDNTIYPATAIADEVFKPIYDLLNDHADEIGEDNINEIKQKLMKKAYQVIADEYKLSEDLKKKGTEILRHVTYDRPIEAFPDYEIVKSLEQEKFLVTMGFTKLQQSKVRMLDLNSDYNEIIVNDPDTTDNTKKEVFKDLLVKYGYQPNEVLIIGDDPESEIGAGNTLNIPTVLYDKQNEYPDAQATHRIKHYQELLPILDSYQN